MKKPTLNVLFLAILFTLLNFPFNLISQNDSGFVISIDYMDAKSGREYVDMEKNIYKPLHAHAIDQGEKIAWMLYEVIYPYGEDTRYNYATVNFFKDSKQALDGSWTDFMTVFNEIHPDIDINELNELTEKSRDLVSGEMFALVDEAIPGPSEIPSEYISVNHMVVQPGRDQEYIGMEIEIFKPVHLQRIKEGNAMDWLLFRRLFPYGAEFGYQYVTIDVHGSLDQMVTPNTNETWELTHPDKTANDYYNKIDELRTLKRQETWRLVDYTYGNK